jgi:hypothetical protein
MLGPSSRGGVWSCLVNSDLVILPWYYLVCCLLVAVTFCLRLLEVGESSGVTGSLAFAWPALVHQTWGVALVFFAETHEAGVGSLACAGGHDAHPLVAEVLSGLVMRLAHWVAQADALGILNAFICGVLETLAPALHFGEAEVACACWKLLLWRYCWRGRWPPVCAKLGHRRSAVRGRATGWCVCAWPTVAALVTKKEARKGWRGERKGKWREGG